MYVHFLNTLTIRTQTMSHLQSIQTPRALLPQHKTASRKVIGEDKTYDVEEDQETEHEKEMPHHNEGEDMAMPVFKNIFEQLNSALGEA